MKFSFTRAALMAGVLTLGAAAVASAQTPPAPGGDAPRVERRVVIMGGPGGPGMGMHGAMDPEMHAQHLRDVLQLRPEQEGALKTFLAAMAPPARDAAARKPMDRPKTTPERLTMMEKMMAEHQAMFKTHSAAIRAFYGQLSPAQQKAFDALHMGMGRGGMHGRGMRMMHPGMAAMPGMDDDDAGEHEPG